ncbi:MAG: 16S rRNA (cytidine(1402)-2'-O)-methyltransferase [Candidatus Zophobacter franzmannii]|nr:16S rRNA (cytidine(1402)-2'-O)-methyltransferase [Candidatus Zophobacter franzmannii]
MELKFGLYIIATPIGNPDDITIRALNTLKAVDLVVLEERKPGTTLLRRHEIKTDWIELNEHNEKKMTDEIFEMLIMERKTVGLISDAGTPLFADPGNKLVHLCHENGIPVYPVPGASSLMAMLQVSGIPLRNFHFYGFLPPGKEERIQALKTYKAQYNIDTVFLDAPYRLKSLLRDMANVLGSNRKAIVGYKLTYPQEKIFLGTLGEMITMTEDLPKGEFVVVISKVLKKS